LADRRAAGTLAERGAHGGDRFLRLAAVGAAALGHVRPSAAALPAEGGRRVFDELGGRMPGGEIVGDADGYGPLAVLTPENQRNDARAGALLLLVDEAAQVPGR